MKRFILIAMAILMASLGARAQSFTARLDNGEQFCFHIADTTQNTVEIVRVKLLGSAQPPLPSGDLVIPSTVKFKNTVYSVISIGESAFAGAEELKSVSIPSSVRRIGDKAFSDCTGLQSLVFPGSTPSIGEKAFENCRSLTSLSFGSDWSAIDFQLFADSESIKEVFIPARVNRITGLKKLVSLEKIEVDANNRHFSSHDGILYSKDGLTLYACPRAKSGCVSVYSEAERILDGAFSNCATLEGILLPASIHEFAYDEFMGCAHLKTITLLSEVPPMTAKWNGAVVFAVEAPNPECILQVKKEYLSRYQINIYASEGTFETLKGERRAEIPAGKMMDKSLIKRTK